MFERFLKKTALKNKSNKLYTCNTHTNTTYNIIFVDSGTDNFQTDLVILLDYNILEK